MMAICPAGPPKLVKPSFSQKQKASPKLGGAVVRITSLVSGNLAGVSRLARCFREEVHWTPARACVTSRAGMTGATKLYFIVFGLLTIAGGVIGYVKAGSPPSLVAGSISGALLLVAAFLLPQHRIAGLVIALVVSLLLAVQFVPKFFRTGKIMPAGVMAILSVLGLIAAIAAWLKE